MAVAKSLLVVMGFTGLFHVVRQTSTAKGELLLIVLCADHQSVNNVGPNCTESVGIRHDVHCWHEQGYEVQFYMFPLSENVPVTCLCSTNHLFLPQTCLVTVEVVGRQQQDNIFSPQNFK